MGKATLMVNTIYPAFMGEVNCHGIGVPATFIRLAGCNLRCYYRTKGFFCDTPEALSLKSGKPMGIAEIITKVTEYNNEVVCLTGGEPLLQDVHELLSKLSNLGYKVVIETNGSMDITPYRHIRNVSFVVDVKLSSSGEEKRMFTQNYYSLYRDDYLKFVVDTEQDFLEFQQWLNEHKYLGCNIAVGLFWGSKVSYQWLMEQLLSLNRQVYLNMQAHKMTCIYDIFKSEEKFENIIIPKDI